MILDIDRLYTLAAVLTERYPLIGNKRYSSNAQWVISNIVVDFNMMLMREAAKYTFAFRNLDQQNLIALADKMLSISPCSYDEFTRKIKYWFDKR